jgi:hypothetical protein
MTRTLIAISLIVAAATPAWAQLGIVNPNGPVAIITLPPDGSPKGTPPTVRPSIPFGNEPNQLNNPYPTLPTAGISGTGGWGVPIRSIQVPAQIVPIAVYDRYMELAGEPWTTQYTEVPGYVIVETTLGYVYPERWALYSPARGVYQWARVPSAFQPK